MHYKLLESARKQHVNRMRQEEVCSTYLVDKKVTMYVVSNTDLKYRVRVSVYKSGVKSSKWFNEAEEAMDYYNSLENVEVYTKAAMFN